MPKKMGIFLSIVSNESNVIFSDIDEAIIASFDALSTYEDYDYDEEESV